MQLPGYLTPHLTSHEDTRYFAPTQHPHLVSTLRHTRLCLWLLFTEQFLPQPYSRYMHLSLSLSPPPHHVKYASKNMHKPVRSHLYVPPRMAAIRPSSLNSSLIHVKHEELIPVCVTPPMATFPQKKILNVCLNSSINHLNHDYSYSSA
jgi:hypothetical protein